jgi:hypothetical protein
MEEQQEQRSMKENIVELLINNAIDNAASSLSNTTSSLPQSSFIISRPSNQSHTYRIKEPETHYNSKNDSGE